MTSAEVRFIRLYDSHLQRITNYCGRRVAADRVEDAVADVFMTAWRRIDELPEGDAELGWLYGVAYRVVGHQWRGSKRHRRLSDKLLSLGRDPVDAPDDVVVLREESRIAINALRRLRPIDREILMLAGWEELSHRQIAAAIGISVEAVGQRLFKAKHRLTAEFNRQQGSPSKRRESEVRR